MITTGGRTHFFIRVVNEKFRDFRHTAGNVLNRTYSHTGAALIATSARHGRYCYKKLYGWLFTTDVVLVCNRCDRAPSSIPFVEIKKKKNNTNLRYLLYREIFAISGPIHICLCGRVFCRWYRGIIVISDWMNSHIKSQIIFSLFFLFESHAIITLLLSRVRLH